MKLVEFDVTGSTYVEGLKLKNRLILEERSVPLCFGILPKVFLSSIEHTTPISYILTLI